MLVPLDPITGQRKKNLSKDEQKDISDAVARDDAMKKEKKKAGEKK